jgi:hypothetical protein
MKRQQVPPTDDWQQLQLLAKTSEQRTHERIRSVVLFGQPTSHLLGALRAARQPAHGEAQSSQGGESREVLARADRALREGDEVANGMGGTRAVG